MKNLNNYFTYNTNITSKKACPYDGGCFFSVDIKELAAQAEYVKKAFFPTGLSQSGSTQIASLQVAPNNVNPTPEVNMDFESGVAVYNSKTGELIDKYPFAALPYYGNLHAVYIENYDFSDWCYVFYYGEIFLTDIRADRYINVPKYGEFNKLSVLQAVIDAPIDYSDDCRPDISYENAFVYQMHVRGFTKHSSSGTRYKGTFRGVADKLEYLKKLGVTTIEMQPVNEFYDIDDKTNRLNYWGYCKGLYYAPKAAYSYSDNCSTEFFELVKAIHSSGLELILQMYFPGDFSQSEILNILEYWTVKYHVDGFHILSEKFYPEMIDASAVLSDSKIWCDRLDGFDLSSGASYNASDKKRIALYRDDYLYTMRRFLKADEFSILEAVSKIRSNPNNYAIINYFSSFNSMTLWDMVSYERKHNEENGEDNRDGSDYNCTWNCGEEGLSRKPKVIALRRKQLKNALMLLMLSAGTPMIYMGDEFGRTQLGNNNPYCIDSKTTWLDWSNLKKQYNLYEYICDLIAIRKQFNVLHCNHELTMLDVCGCGYPELSYHGDNAWISQPDGYKHDIGIMYCDNGKLLYMAINMHWNAVNLSLPRPPKGCCWKLMSSTEKTVNSTDNNIVVENKVLVNEHSINLYMVEALDVDKALQLKTDDVQNDLENE